MPPKKPCWPSSVWRRRRVPHFHHGRARLQQGVHTYFATAREQHGIRYVRCRVSNVREDPATHDLILHYADADGQLREERFETVVLAIGLQPPDSARQLAELLGIELNEYGFCQTDKFTPLQTSRPGVFVCGAFSSPKEIVETIIDASGAAAEVMRLLNDQLAHARLHARVAVPLGR